MIGNAEVMQKLYRLTRLVAPRMTTVMIAGATGTGKELVARAIHQLSARAAKPWAVVNCAAIPEALLESELFGHVRGAFTGAVQGYAGRIHLAQGGTLFLDEVGELPLSLQAKLLRFLDQKEVQRLGSSETLKVDVRVVAASNANLARCVDEGRFRDDLYYRLSTFPLQLPTLAERSGDVLRAGGILFAGDCGGGRRSGGDRCAGGPRARSPRLAGQRARVAAGHERAYILAEGGQEILPEHLCFASLRGTRRAESSTQVAAACARPPDDYGRCNFIHAAAPARSRRNRARRALADASVCFLHRGGVVARICLHAVAGGGGAAAPRTRRHQS